jgi:ketosteroid isomerase-like protein
MVAIIAVKQRGIWCAIAALLVLKVIGAGPLFAQAKNTASVEDAIRALESRRAEALLKADTKALADMVADDFIEISRLGQLRTKADNIRDIASGDLKLISVKYEDLKVRVYGEVAILIGIADNTGTARGTPFAGKIRYTRIFVRREGRWQAVMMQQTSIAEGPR